MKNFGAKYIPRILNLKAIASSIVVGAIPFLMMVGHSKMKRMVCD